MKSNLTFIAFILLFASSLTAQKKFFPACNSNAATSQMYEEALYAGMNADHHKFNQLMDQVIEKDPNCFMAHANKAIMAFHTNKMDVFKTHARKAVSIEQANDVEKGYAELLTARLDNPKADVGNIAGTIAMHNRDVMEGHMLHGMIQHEMERPMIALEVLYGANKVVPDFPPLYNMLGYTQMELGNMDSAEKMFAKYMELLPNHANPYDSMGDFLFKKGNYEEAASMYKKAYAMNNSFEISLEKAKEATAKMEAQNNR